MVRRTASAGNHGPGSVLLRAVLKDCINTAGRGVGIDRNRPRGPRNGRYYRNGHHGLSINPGPAIGFEGEGMACRGETSARSRPRAPHLTIERAGCRGMAVGLMWPDPSPSPGGGAARRPRGASGVAGRASAGGNAGTTPLVKRMTHTI